MTASSRAGSGETGARQSPLSGMLGAVAVQCLFLVMSLGTGILTARVLGPEGRGIFAAVTTLPQLLSGIAGAGFGGAVIVMLRQAGSTDAARIVAGNALQLGFVTATLATAIGIPLTPYVMNGYSAEAVAVGQWSLIGIYASLLLVIYRSGFAGRGAFNPMNLMGLAPQLIYLVALALWIALLPLTATQAALLFLGSSCLGVVAFTPAFIAACRPILGSFGRAPFRGFRSYVGRALGYDLVLVISNSVDRLILIPFVPAAELGLYAVAVGLARLVAVVHPAINTVLLSSLSQKTDPHDLKQLHDRAFRFALLGLLAVIAVAVPVSGWLLVLVYGAEFVASSRIFDILVFEATLGCLLAITTQTYLAWNRPGAVSLVYGLSLVVFLAAAAILVPWLGAVGAAWALLAGTAARLLGLLGCLPLHYGMSLPRLVPDREDFSYLAERMGALRRR